MAVAFSSLAAWPSHDIAQAWRCPKEKMPPFGKEGVYYLIWCEHEDEVIGEGGADILDPCLHPAYVYDVLIEVLDEILLQVRPEPAMGGGTC